MAQEQITFSTAARRRLVDKDMQVKQLAARIGYPSNTVSSVLRGTKKFRHVRAKIVRALDLPKELISEGMI